MTKFLKPTIYGMIALVGLGSFVFGRDVLSYVRTSASSVREAVKSEVPIEFEVQRARDMVENLVPDIRRCMHVIAEQQVDVEALRKEIDTRNLAMADQKKAILALRSDLSTGDTQFVYLNRTYSAGEVERDLAHRLDRYKIAKETLEREDKILHAREKALVANQNKLEGMLGSKQDLEVKIEQLEARLKSVEAAETVSTLEIDNSQLTRAKSLIKELNKQLDVKVRLLDAEGKFTGLIPVEAEEVPVRDIAAEVDTYFGDEPGDDIEL